MPRAIPEVFVVLDSPAEPTRLIALFPLTALIVKSVGDDSQLEPAIEREIAGLLPGVPSISISRALSPIDTATKPWRLGATMLLLLGLMTVFIAVVGVYSSVAYVVAQRRRELAIRIALGATPWRLVWRTIVPRTFAAAASGLGLGLLAAFFLSRLVTALVFGISPTNPVVYITATVVLGVVTGLASVLPARRLKRISLLDALGE